MKPLDLNIYRFPIEFDFYNGQYPPLDALTYWHFLKKANKVVEIGCGYSTLLPLKSGVLLTAIDPQPRIVYQGISYIFKPVQEVEAQVFLQLEENDILFIDSSHIYSEGSDVWYLINQVIPKLKKGVLIHFHDYFGEYGYPEDWKDIHEMKGWNENQYLIPLSFIHDVLAFNFEICSQHNHYLKSKYPFVPHNITQNFGAVKGTSLWLKK